MIVVRIHLWGQFVGALIEEGGTTSFEYDNKFLANGHSISPLKLPRSDAIFSFPELARKEAFRGLPGVFADSLPDRFGNKIVEKILRDRGIDEFSQAQKLLYVGKRAMGALEFEPASMTDKFDPLPLDIAQLVEESRKVIQGDITTKTAEIMQVGSTAGGMRAKAVIGWNKNNNEVIHGLGHLPQGFEPWILKFDGVNQVHEPWCALEYIYMQLSAQAGIKTPQTRLLTDNKLKHLMIQRFDRVNGQKVHMHSLGGLIHSDYNDVREIDYKNFISIAKSIGCPSKDIRDLFKRMVFNILANNNDDHVKNFSFLMEPNGRWSLSPTYDVTYIQGGPWTQGHQMTCNGKANGITWDDIQAVADDCSIDQPLLLAQEVVESLSDFSKLAKETGLEAQIIKKVSSEMNLKILPKRTSQRRS